MAGVSPAPSGTYTSYDLTVGVKLNVENVIWTISPFDVPLQGTMGADGRTALSSDTCFEKKIEWLDELLLTASSSTVTNVATADTFITVSTAGNNAGAFQYKVGDVLLVDSEYMIVTAYGTTSGTLVVTKGFGGSTSTIHTTGSLVKGVGQALAEGSDAGTARAIDRVNRNNYTQIFGPVPVQVSGSENAVQKYGLTGTEFDHQVANRLKETFVDLEQALLYGNQYESSTLNARTMGGFTNYITTNVDSTTTTVSESALLTQLQACFDAGGSPDRIVVGSKQKQALSGLAGGGNGNSTPLIRYTQDTNIRGQVVDYYDSDFGRQMIVLDRWCRKSDLFVFNRDQATIATLRPFTFEMLAKTGDSTKGQIVGEKSLWFRKQQHAARFSALT